MNVWLLYESSSLPLAALASPSHIFKGCGEDILKTWAAEEENGTAAGAAEPIIALSGLCESIWGANDVNQPHLRWNFNPQVKWAIWTFVGMGDKDKWDEEEDEEVKRQPITRSQCSIATCLFHKDFDMR
jgi:hypothetical protein